MFIRKTLEEGIYTVNTFYFKQKKARFVATRLINESLIPFCATNNNPDSHMQVIINVSLNKQNTILLN